MVSKTTQSKEIIQKYRHAFLQTAHFGMDNRDEIKLLSAQYNEIDDEIELAMEFLDRHNFGETEEYIRIYAVAVLPFMMFAGKLIDPIIDTKKRYEDALQWLIYIRDNKGMMVNQLIHSTTTDKYTEGNPPIGFDDFKGFDMKKVNEHIKHYKFLAQLDVGREKRVWWSSSEAFKSMLNFTYVVYLAWSREKEDGTRFAEQDRIIYFLEEFFTHMGYPIHNTVIKSKILNIAKAERFIVDNPYWVADNLLT